MPKKNKKTLRASALSVDEQQGITLDEGLVHQITLNIDIFFGPVAQLGEHFVRNEGVRGSNPLRSTKDLLQRRIL